MTVQVERRETKTVRKIIWTMVLIGWLANGMKKIDLEWTLQIIFFVSFRWSVKTKSLLATNWFENWKTFYYAKCDLLKVLQTVSLRIWKRNKKISSWKEIQNIPIRCSNKRVPFAHRCCDLSSNTKIGY